MFCILVCSTLGNNRKSAREIQLVTLQHVHGYTCTCIALHWGGCDVYTWMYILAFICCCVYTGLHLLLFIYWPSFVVVYILAFICCCLYTGLHLLLFIYWPSFVVVYILAFICCCLYTGLHLLLCIYWPSFVVVYIQGAERFANYKGYGKTLQYDREHIEQSNVRT